MSSENELKEANELLPPQMQSGVVVLYDAICPTCVEDRRRYQSFQRQTDESVHWLDVNSAAALLESFNINQQDAISELHLIVDGKMVVKELDAYILLFKQLPKFRWVGWLIGLPIVKPLLSRYYHYRVQKRLKRTGRLGHE